MLVKNSIDKRRNVRMTCCEFFSHLIIILLLVYGFQRSRVLNFPQSSYSTLSIRIPQDAYFALGLSGNIETKSPTARPTRTPFTSHVPTVSPTTRPTLTPQMIVQPISTLTVLTAFLQGPLPIFTFDQFINAVNSLSNTRIVSNNVALTNTGLGRQYANLYTRNQILHFAPQGVALNSLLRYLNRTTTTFKSFPHMVHNSEEDAVDFILNSRRRALALIVINSATPALVDFTIRQNYSTLPNTNLLINPVSIGLNALYQTYYTSGFLSLQKAVNGWAFEYTNATKPSLRSSGCTPPEMFTMPMPTPAYNQNPFYDQVGFLLGLALTMSTLYPMSRLVKTVVEEKELKMREVMKIMGLKDWVHHCAWFVTAFVLFLWISVSSWYLTSVTFLTKTNKLILFLYFFLFNISEITLSFLVAVFFNNSKLAAIVGPVVLFVFLCPRFMFLTTNSAEEITGKIVASFLSPTAFSFGADVLTSYEAAGVGVQFSNINDGDYSFNTSLAFMAVDTLIYGFLAWYLEKVLPSEYGTPMKPWFLLQASYWWPASGKLANGVNALSHVAVEELLELSEKHKNDSVELLSSDQKKAVQVVIQNLTKRYDDGKLAVKRLDLAMLEGQITCLLGHNGAGKTTTISMLTGLIVPTSGECSIWGRRLSRDLSAIRELTGICPQHNVLFPTLTVTEHLRFFGVLKGLGGKALNEAVLASMRDVGLTEKAHASSSALSGGMKRKLCLAMALIGDPKFILLDEPTSGMDPYSRRSTWELLRKSKIGRVIVLTTHFMDEADILGDRIAIMSEGRLRCSGSSLFLKNRFGVGYVLAMAKSRGDCSVTEVSRFVQSYVPEAQLTSAVAGEMMYQMPTASARSFGALFSSLKERAPELGVGAYGVSITTLEQVFIRLAQEVSHGGVDADDSMRPGVLASLSRWVGRHLEYLLSCIVTKCKVRPDEASPAGKNLKINSGQKGGDSGKSPWTHVVPMEVIEDTETAFTHEEKKEQTVTPIPEPLYDTWTEPVQIRSGDRCIDQTPAESPNEKMNITVASVPVQLLELFRKRYVIACRDVKGLFYQVVFPAVQIVLVLYILTIDLNPPGKSISLNANIYPSDVEIVWAGNRGNLVGANWLGVSPIPNNYSPQPRNSRSLSEGYLTNTLTSHAKSRYGAYVFRDQISTNITIDWDNSRPLLLLFIPESTLNLVDTTLNFKQILTANELSLQERRTLLNQNILTAKTRVNEIASTLQSATGVNISTTALLDIFQQIQNASSTNVSLALLNGLLPTTISFPVSIPGVLTLTIKSGTLNYSANNAIDFLDLHGVRSYSALLNNPYSVLHNSSSPHAVAAYSAQLTSTAFAACSPSEKASYTSRNYPLPLTAAQTVNAKIILAIFASLFVLIPLCYIPAAFVTFVVKERVSKSKHLQIVSSVSPYLYWIATYLWDMTLYSFLSVFVLVAFFVYGSQDNSAAFVSTSESTACVFCLVFLFGASCIPLSYLYSFAFDNHATAQISIMTINFFTGFVFVLGYYVMSTIPELQPLAAGAVQVFRLFPPYNVGEGLLAISSLYFQKYLGSVTANRASYFNWSQAGKNVVYLAAESVFFLSIVLLSESGIVRLFLFKWETVRAKAAGTPPEPKTMEDEDVTAEREKLTAFQPNQFALLVRNLIKTYPPSILCGKAKFAVRGVSLGCPVGETFGLLGINGAGKTTTLSILTGDFEQTSGEAYIAGLPLSHPTTRKMLGYCPQVDPLLDLMTGFETLWFFGRIRGMTPSVLTPKIEALVQAVGLAKHAHRPCGTYSGGNKRKLSLAVALIGDPKVLFLDEPSTGMDPEARRHMWSVIAAVAKQRSVVLTTHSMEECEALCNRVGIMVSGRMQCLGSIQHLKGRFGASYEIEVRCAEGRADEAKTTCLRLISGTAVEESHGDFFRLRVSSGSLDLGHTFSVLEASKEGVGIIDYSVSQATLEQIFIRFAKEQEEEPAVVTNAETRN